MMVVHIPLRRLDATTDEFHDIVSGTNGTYQSLTAWDYTSGLGAITIGTLVPMAVAAH
jgi:hypothetical protein